MIIIKSLISILDQALLFFNHCTWSVHAFLLYFFLFYFFTRPAESLVLATDLILFEIDLFQSRFCTRMHMLFNFDKDS